MRQTLGDTWISDSDPRPNGRGLIEASTRAAASAAPSLTIRGRMAAASLKQVVGEDLAILDHRPIRGRMAAASLKPVL